MLGTVDIGYIGSDDDGNDNFAGGGDNNVRC